MSSKEAPVVFEFDGFRLDPAHRTLSRGGREIPVGSRAFDVLVTLVEARGALVQKQELLNRVWPGMTVEHNTLQAQISTIRRALGAGHDLIATISGRGYRFVGDVRKLSKAARTVEPASAPRAAPMSNLPEAGSDMIGREREVEEIGLLLRESRTVTVAGASGVGKTRVALATARLALPDFADGAWLVELDRIADPERVPAAVAASLRLEIAASPIPAELLSATLAPKRLLLVLDGCDRVLDAVAAIVHALLAAGSHVRVLATAIEPLRIDGESVYRLAPLALAPRAAPTDEMLRAPAVRLFLTRARAADPRGAIDPASVPVVADICRRLDGIPLAIELAAARAAALGVDAIARRLDKRFRLLTEGRRTAPPRHRTLQAAFEWTWSLLSQPEQTVLRRLSVFVGVFDLDAAAAVAGFAPELGAETESIVAGLVAKSLVAAQPGAGSGRQAALRLLETTREFARARLSESGESGQAALRHASYWKERLAGAQAAHSALPDEAWRADFASRLDDIRAAIDWALSAAGDQHLGVALTAETVPLWMRLSLLGECRDACNRALAALGPAELGGRDEMVLRTALGASLVHSTGLLPEAWTAWSKALEIARALDDVEHQMRALFGLWLFNIRSGEARAAFERARELEAAAARSPDENDGLVAERVLGVSELYLGELAPARRHLERMIAQYAPRQRRAAIVGFGLDHKVAALTNLARVLWLQGFPDQAVATAAEALAEARSLDHASSLCLALVDGIFAIATLVGDLGVAEQAHAEAKVAAKAHGLELWQTLTATMDGWVAVDSDGPPGAAQSLRAALAGAEKAQFHLRYSRSLGTLAEALAARGRKDEALNTIDRALERVRRSQELWCLPELLRVKARILLTGSDADHAGADGCLADALAEARRQGALSIELRVATLIALARQAQGRGREGGNLLRAVCSRFSEGFTTSDFLAAQELLDGTS
ncbi:MAG TPA: winged helix-turn-helix domain-containing protein [Stellaceae bacterium]|nr:winged helix-turn-helix domain-containing protein [Stellaceae bacterium]